MRVADDFIELTQNQFNVLQVLQAAEGMNGDPANTWADKIATITPLIAVLCKSVREQEIRAVYGLMAVDIDNDREQFIFARDLVTWYSEVGVLEVTDRDEFIDSLVGDADDSYSLSDYPFDEECRSR